MTCAGSSAFAVAASRDVSSKGLSRTRLTQRRLRIERQAPDIGRPAVDGRTRAPVVIGLVVPLVVRGGRVDQAASAAGRRGADERRRGAYLLMIRARRHT